MKYVKYFVMFWTIGISGVSVNENVPAGVLIPAVFGVLGSLAIW